MTGLAGFLMLTFWCHGPLSPFLPAMYEPVLIAYGGLYPPLWIGSLGALLSLLPEYVNLRIYRVALGSKMLARTRETSTARRVARGFERAPLFTTWLCAWSPLPDWAARSMAALTRYPATRYLAACFAGRFPKYWFLAALGPRFNLSRGTLAVIIAGSLVLGFGGAVWRRWRSYRARGKLAGSAGTLVP